MRYDPELGLAIRRLRHAKGVTQEALADRIDVSAPTLCSLERGLIDPPWSRVRRIARALDVDMNELGAAVDEATL
jgi:transcriptional regulator with XRE-family HTH domain